MSKGFAHESSHNESVEWYTPYPIFDALGIEFDLDPCSPGAKICPWIPAKKHLTVEDNGLMAPWEIRKWLNPPICSCRVEPVVIDWQNGNKEMSQMLTGLASHARSLSATDGDAMFYLVVQNVREGLGKTETKTSSRRPSGTQEIISRKETLCTKRKGDTRQTKSNVNRQSQETATKTCGSLQMDSRDLVSMSKDLGQQVCVLWCGNTINARSFYSVITSKLHGNNSKQYGSSVLEMQFSQRKSAPNRMGQRQASICPNCGKAGFSRTEPAIVFLNPPYGSDTPLWMKRLKEHGEGIALVFSRCDTKWFHDFIPYADAICFLKGRVQFVPADKADLYADAQFKPKGGCGAGSMLIAFGKDNARALFESGLGLTVHVNNPIKE